MKGLGFPVSSDGKESSCNAGDPGLSPWTEEPGGLQSMGLQRVDTLVVKPLLVTGTGTRVYWSADNVLLLGLGSSYLSGTDVSICTNSPSCI